MLNIDFLPWDSDFFQLKIGKISSDDVNKEILLATAKQENYQLIYLFSTELLAEFSTLLKDRKVIYETKIIDNQFDTHKNIFFLEKNGSPNEQLFQLALQSGEYSRFRLDEHFPKGSFEKMYALWMQKSLNKTIADKVIVYQEDQQNLGMVTLKHEAECTRIGLIAVDETTRGKRIGSHLLDAVKKESTKKGKTSVEVATQLDNENACRFYEKNNFFIKKIEYIYHIWL